MRKSPRDLPAAVAVSRFIAKASVLATLLRSRLAMPLLYPLNSAGLTTTALNDDNGGKNPIAASRWDKKVLTNTLGHMTPAVIGMSKVALMLKAANSLSHYHGGSTRRTAVARRTGSSSISRSRAAATNTRGGVKNRLHLLHPQVWRMLKPGDEKNTRFLPFR